MLNAGWRFSGHMKDENQLLQQKLRAMVEPKEPRVSMSDLVQAELKATSDHGDVFVEQLDSGVQFQTDRTSKFVANNLLFKFTFRVQCE